MNYKEIWGIDIGYSCIRAVKLVSGKEGIRLVDYDIRELSYKGKDSEKILESIKKALVGLAGRKSLLGENVFISVPGAQSFQRIVRIPPCPLSKVRELMQYEATQQIPFDLKEVIWDYKLISADKDVSKGRSVLLFAVKKQVLKPLLDFCESAMMRVVGVQLSHVALLNFLIREHDPDKPFGILDIGAKHSEFLVCDTGGTDEVLMRPVNVTGNLLTETLASRSRKSFLEAETAKIEAFSGDGETEVLEGVMSNLATEATRSLGYFRSQLKGREIEKIFLTGRGVGFEVGREFLKKRLNKPLKIIEAPNQLSYKLKGAPEVFFDDCRQLGVSFGLALQGLGKGRFQTNLLPLAIQFDNVLARKRVSVGIALGLMWIAMLVSFFYTDSALQTANAQNKQLKAVVQEVDDAWQTYQDISDKIEPVVMKARNLASFGHGREQPLRAINEFYSALNRLRASGEKMWLSSLKFEKKADEAMQEIVIDIPQKYAISNYSMLIGWKSTISAPNDEEKMIFRKFEPYRVPMLFRGTLSGIAPMGEGANKLNTIERYVALLSEEGSVLSKVMLDTNWKPVDKQLPYGTTLTVIDFDIHFEFRTPPYIDEPQTPEDSLPPIPEVSP
ncbi:MAG: pilus assembly protein PilM [Planctomycetota bacterium]|nr:pilus assembly protein PilM [Planctomycetota bacterium]